MGSLQPSLCEMTSTFLPMDKSLRSRSWIPVTVRSALAIGICLLLAVQASDTLRAQTEFDPSACSNGRSVPDPEANPGLVSDCAILLGIKHNYPGFSSLPWWKSVSISKWEGVFLKEGRVKLLRLPQVTVQS